jgi:hypothetical protein
MGLHVGFCAAAIAAVLTLGAANAADKPGERVLTPEEIAEKESRKACKIALCDALRSKAAEGGDIACDIVKTWREEDIEKMISGGRVDWPYGRALCRTKLNAPRAGLVRAMTEKRYDFDLPKHRVSCELDRKSKQAPYKVELDIAPRVTFENGKAVAAKVNWGDLEAPTLAKGVLWPGSALDNSVNILGAEIVRMTNEFTGKKCDEVRTELEKAPGADVP